jgi:hypothetical protein
MDTPAKESVIASLTCIEGVLESEISRTLTGEDDLMDGSQRVVPHFSET